MELKHGDIIYWNATESLYLVIKQEFKMRDTVYEGFAERLSTENYKSTFKRNISIKELNNTLDTKYVVLGNIYNIGTTIDPHVKELLNAKHK